MKRILEKDENMTYETQTMKSYNGWEAMSETVLEELSEGRRMLQITTSKGRGEVCSHARVHIKNGGVTTTEIFGDFCKRDIEVAPCKRVNEKAVMRVHEQALLQMPVLIEEAKAFYVEKNS